MKSCAPGSNGGGFYWVRPRAVPGTVLVQAHGKRYHLPVARFDNRVDKTSFIREERARWQAGDVRAIHDGLKDAFTRLASTAR